MSSLAKTKTKTRLPESEITARARMILIISVAVTLALYILVPYGDTFARPLVLISTMVHELGHGIAALLVGGKFDKFVMNWDASGTAHVLLPADSTGKWAFVSAGGLIGPAIAGALMLVLARRPKRARITLGVFGGMLILAELLVVRNGFGVAFIGLFAVICLAIAIWTSDDFAQVSLVFIASQLALSVYARADYLFTESAGPTSNSDVKNMELAIGLPYWFWGGVCIVISIAALVAGGWFFIRPAKSSSTARLRPGMKL